jgi:hypothetical protein
LESVWVNAAEKQVLKAQPTMGLCIDVAMLWPSQRSPASLPVACKYSSCSGCWPA